MKVGTKSVLWGAHCWFIHPWFVALAWWKLFGFPRDWRLWFAFFVHDLGYFGLPNMDGKEGERHVEWGARQMAKVVDTFCAPSLVEGSLPDSFVNYEAWVEHDALVKEWHDFCLYHSRFYAKQDNKPFSKLCVADKLATSLEPWWLYLPRVILSGEIKEYMALAAGNGKNGEFDRKGKYDGEPQVEGHEYNRPLSRKAWCLRMQAYLRSWVETHKDGRADTWTPLVEVTS